MRKRAMSIEEVKSTVDALVGAPLKISVNKGRKRVVRYDGSISAVYPSVFTVKIDNDRNLESLSCSYSDVVCGDVKLAERG